MVAKSFAPMGDIEDFFLNKKPVRIMVSLKRPNTDNYATAISRQVDATYAHTVRVLQQMNDFGLVEFDRKGRKKIVELTSRGDTLAEQFDSVLKEFE